VLQCDVLQAYVDELTVDLHSECAPCGVSVENQAPFYVATKMSKIRHARLDAPSPKTWVAAGMRQIGCAWPPKNPKALKIRLARPVAPSPKTWVAAGMRQIA
jgi:hypothetical protein